jgi:hypothetical protein
MGPIASPWVLSLPRRRWLALLAIPVALAAVAAGQPPPTVCAVRAGVERQDLRLDTLARAHRAWVAEHGAGCARGLDHLTPYVVDAEAPDPWGTPLVFSCHREARAIDVTVTSLGADRLPGTADDAVGSDRQRLR